MTFLGTMLNKWINEFKGSIDHTPENITDISSGDASFFFNPKNQVYTDLSSGDSLIFF